MFKKTRKTNVGEGMWMDAQGVVYRQDGDQKILVKVDDHSPIKIRSCWGVDCYTIESGTTRVEDSAFQFCDSLKKVVIPSTVRTIGEYAFNSCSSLEEVCFQQPATLEYLPEHAFWGCNQLREMVIPDSVSYISDYAFYGCNSFRMVVLPDNISFDKPADYTPRGTSNLMEITGLGTKLLHFSLGTLECIKIPAAKRALLEEHWPHLKHLFVDK